MIYENLSTAIIRAIIVRRRRRFKDRLGRLVRCG